MRRLQTTYLITSCESCNYLLKLFSCFNVFPNFWLCDSPPLTIVMALQPGLITRVPHTVWPTERWVTQLFACVKNNKSNLFLNLTKQPYFSLRLTRVFVFLYNTQSDAVKCTSFDEGQCSAKLMRSNVLLMSYARQWCMSEVETPFKIHLIKICCLNVGCFILYLRMLGLFWLTVGLRLCCRFRQLGKKGAGIFLVVKVLFISSFTLHYLSFIFISA